MNLPVNADKREREDALTVFNTRREPTVMEVADAEKYERCTTTIELVTEEGWPVKYLADPNDPQLQYRFATFLRVIPATETFRILLRPGAGPKDLAYAQETIHLIREGRFSQFPWAEHPSKKNPGTTYFGISLGECVRVDAWPREQFVACTESACVEPFHAVDDEHDEYRLHTAEKIESGDWEILVQREANAPWGVFTDFDGGNGDMFTPEEAVSFANDLQWAAATARKLNALKTVA